MKKFEKFPADTFWRKQIDALVEKENDYYGVHRNRYFTTFDWMFDKIKDKKAILELGEKSYFATATSSFLNQQWIATGEQDLRYPLTGLEDSSFDVVVSMEVFEHLNDQTPKDGIDSAEFKHSGIKTCLSEIYRVLKPDGLLLGTTPNKRSFNNLYHYIYGGSMMLYMPHVREYTSWELQHLFTEKQFKVLEMTTKDCYFDYSITPVWLTNFLFFLDKTQHGDTLFFACSKQPQS